MAIALLPPLIEDNNSKNDLLRELRAEVQDLQTVLKSVRKGETTIKANAKYIAKTRDDITRIVTQIWDGDAIGHLQNLCEQMTSNPLLADPDAEITAQEQLHALNLLNEQIRMIEFHVGVLTIPARVNDWLAQARPGYYIPFHIVFEDEVPESEDRARILSYLAWSPRVIKGGIVDAANGLIYRYSDDPRARLRSFLMIMLSLLVTTGAVIGACYLQVPAWPVQPQHLSLLLIGWGAILVGVVVHIGIGSVKQTQSRGSLPPVASSGDLPLILDARVGQILVKLLLAMVGFFGFVFAAGVSNVTPLNAFLVGYSLDSVIGIFGTNIEQQASMQVAALKKQLGVVSD